MRARLFAAVAAAGLLAAGCGSASGVRAGAPDPSPTVGRPDCGDAVVTPGSAGAAAREVCLGVGSTLRVRLTAGATAAESGAALTEVSPGVYRGARTGDAELSGLRRACPPPKPGAMACHAVVPWKVTVDVR